MPPAGLPSLAIAFGEPESNAQLVIGVFLAGFAIAQLVLGPVSDRYGRRPVLLAGLTVYALMGVACLMAENLTMLLTARFVQGVAACAAPVAARAVVADVYDGPAAQRAMSIVTAGMGLAPIAAPMIGGPLLLWFEWPPIFVTLAASGTAMFLAVLLMLQETNPRHQRRDLRPGRVLRNYGQMLANRTFLSFSMPSLLAGGALGAVARGDVADLVADHAGHVGFAFRARGARGPGVARRLQIREEAAGRGATSGANGACASRPRCSRAPRSGQSPRCPKALTGSGSGIMGERSGYASMAAPFVPPSLVKGRNIRKACGKET